MSKPLNRFEKLMLLNAYPIKFTFNLIGGGVALYFLWQQRLIYALLIGGFFVFAGTLLSMKSKTKAENIAGTIIGRIFLSYTSKWGFTCYSISHILIPISIWWHNLYLTAIGITILGMGLIQTSNRKIE